MKYFWAVLMVLSFNIYAEPGNGLPFNNGDQEQTQGQQQGQLQGQLQGQAQGQKQNAVGVGVGISDNDNRNSNTNRNSATALSGSKSGAISGSIAAQKAKTGDITIVEEAEEIPASSAAAVITSVCQVGVSGQTRDGGFAVSNSDQFCQYLKLAAVHLNAYNIHTKMAGKCFQTTETQTFVCPASERAEYSYERYAYFVNEADKLLDRTKGTALLERGASQLLKPLGLVGLLVFLI